MTEKNGKVKISYCILFSIILFNFSRLNEALEKWGDVGTRMAQTLMSATFLRLRASATYDNRDYL